MTEFPRLARRAGGSLAVLIVWLVFATRVIPPLIARAYNDPRLPLFGALIIERRNHTLLDYLGYWTNVTWLGGAWCVVVWLIGPIRSWMADQRFFERSVGAATPGTLGAIRCWVCGILLTMTLWEDLASTALLPRSMPRPKGLLYIFHALPIGFDRFLASAGALWTFQHLTALLLLLGVIGLGTRVVLPAAALCYFLMAGILREYAWFYHTGLIPLYVLAALCFTPCGDGWSVDRAIRIARGARVADAGEPLPVYGWSRYLLWTVVAVPYVAAAFSKLYYSGIAWFGADNMRATLLRTTLMPMQFDWHLSLQVVRAPDFVLVALAGVGLFSELLFGLVLISPRARRVLPVAMLATHVGILFLQNILFPDLILLQAIFYDFSGLRRSAGRWLQRRNGRAQVLYDGQCGLCGRTVRLLRGFDLLDRLEFIDFRAIRPDATSRTTAQEIDLSRLEEEMAVVDRRGRAYWGFAAYRAIAWQVPAFWLALPVLYVPGVRRLADARYRHIAERRARICEIAAPSVGTPPSADLVHARGAAASLAVAAFLLSWWSTHVEFYPFTTMKMFSAMNPTVISYVKPVAIYDDGWTAPARFERWIGAMADSRYREVILAPFQDRADLNRCNAFLDASMQAANRHASEHGRVVGIELQFWQWNFVNDPDNPNHGQVMNTFVHRSASMH